MKVDRELIKKCIKKERKAQFELYRTCYSIMMSVCTRYKNSKEESEEVMNIGFLKVLQNLDKYNEKAPFEAWIRRIMINTIIDEHRKMKKEAEVMEYTDFEDGSFNRHFNFNEAAEQFDAEELQELLNGLPEMSRKVFNLYAIDGYTHKEIGNMLGISDGTSKWHVSFARKQLQQSISQQLITKDTIKASHG